MTPQAVPGGGVEQDPEQLWESVCAAGREAIANAGAGVTALGFANQGETVLAWDRNTGRPLSTAVSWQDRRAGAICAAMAGEADDLTRTTGLPLDPYFAGPKMTWLRRNVTAEGVVTTSDAWLVHRLTGAYVTDVTTASRTLLLDLATRTWSEGACAAFGLDAKYLPEVVGSAQEVGHTDVFGPSLLLSGLSVDQQAALVGEHCLEPGESKCTYGTGAFLLANAGPRPFASSGGLAVSVAWQLGDEATYCIDGQVYAAGAAIAWLLRWGFLRRAEDLDAVAGSVADSGGLTVVPALEWPRSPLVATRCPRQHRGDRPGHPARPRGAGHRGGPGGPSHAPRPRRGDRSRASARAPSGRRRADPLTPAHAAAGRPAPTSRRSRCFAACHRGGRGRVGPARCGGRRDAPGRRPLGRPEHTRYEPTMAPDEAAGRLARFERAVARLDGMPPRPCHDRFPEVRRRHHRGRRRRHRYRAPTGPLSAPHRGARALQRCRHRNVEGEHGDRAHRVRRRSGQPRVVLGAPRPRAAHFLRARIGHRARKRPGPFSWPGMRNRQPGSTTSSPRPKPMGTSGAARIELAHLYQREPHLERTATGAVAIPDESIICPWSPSIAFATEAIGAGVELRLGVEVTDVARDGDAWLLHTPGDRSGPTWVVNAAGLGSDLLNRLFGHDEFTIAPRRGQLIVFDKLARPLVSSIVLPVPTERTKGVLVAPTVYGNVLVGPTAEDIADRGDSATTATGLDLLLEAGRRIVPGLVHEEVTATYAGIRAATEHRDYQITIYEQRALRLRRGHQVDGPHRFTGHRRVRRRAHGGRRTAARRGRAGAADPPHAPARRTRDTTVRGCSADGGRSGLPPHRVLLRAGDRRRNPGRAQRACPGDGPRRHTAPDPSHQRTLSGLLLRRGDRGPIGGGDRREPRRRVRRRAGRGRRTRRSGCRHRAEGRGRGRRHGRGPRGRGRRDTSFV